MDIQKKLHNIQQRFKADKSDRNIYMKFNFRNIEKMLTTLKPILHELELNVIFSEDYINDKFFKSTVRLIDINDGEEVSSSSICAIDTGDAKGISNAQGCGASLTYSRKYTLQSLLAIDDGTNDPDSYDGNTAQPTQPQQYNKKTKQENIDEICDKINSCNTIEELTELWNKIGKWNTDPIIKSTFSARKIALK